MSEPALQEACQPVSAISRALNRAFRLGDGLLDWLPVGIYACDLEGYVVQYNRRAAELWGKAPDLVDGRTRFCGAHCIRTPEGDAVPFEDIPMAGVLKTGTPVRDREVIVERPDGSRITVLVNINPLFDDDGTLIGAVNCFQDITARKLAEDRLRERECWYRDLLEALPAAIYTTDSKGRITFFNQAAADLTGRRPELGTDEWCVSWRLYWPDGTPLAHEDCPMAKALREGKSIRDMEAIAERPDGTKVPFLPYPSPLYDEHGKMVGAVNMLVDISERKKAEEEKTLLLRELAHRVNNTFAVILAITQQSLRNATSGQDFADTLTGRLQALAEAHNLLVAENWTGAEIGDLARSQLAPFASEEGERLRIEGPNVMLSPPQVIALGVVLHELGTNAAKHGALSVAAGRVDLNWTVENGSVVLNWTERDGPKVAPPSRKGLGSKLIERGLPDAKIDWRLPPTGAVCTIQLPIGARKATNGSGAPLHA